MSGGSKLGELTGAEGVPLDDALETMTQVKNAAEMALIRESSRGAGLAHRQLLDLTRVGRSETEVEDAAASRANGELHATPW